MFQIFSEFEKCDSDHLCWALIGQQRWALDWIRTICFLGIWIGSRLRIVSNTLDQDLFWTQLLEKNCSVFVMKNLFFVNFWISFGFRFVFWKILGTWLDLDGVFKIQDWIWIVKYDSPLRSSLLGRVRSSEFIQIMQTRTKILRG